MEFGAPLVAHDLNTKQEFVAVSVTNAIRSAQLHGKSALSSDQWMNIRDMCKQAVEATLKLKKTIQGVKRPYIIYATELDEVCKETIGELSKLRKYFQMHTPQEHRNSLENCISVIDEAEQTINDFMLWIRSGMNSYLLATEGSLLEVQEPDDVDAKRTDMMRCPRWILKQLYEARQIQAQQLTNGKTKINPIETHNSQVDIQAQVQSLIDLNNTRMQLEQSTQELQSVKTQLDQQLNANNSMQNQLKSLQSTAMLVQQKEKALMLKDQTIQQKDASIKQLKTRIAELEAKYEEERKKNEKKDSDPPPEAANDKKEESEKNVEQSIQIEQMTEDLEKKNHVIVSYEHKVQQLTNRMRTMLESKRNLEGTISKQQISIKEMENKMRIQQAQLRMSRINADALNPADLSIALIMADLHEPLQNDELQEADRILEQLLDKHAKENETTKDTITEVEQDDDDDLPASEIDYKTASTWLSETEKRQCLSQLILDPSRNYEFIRLLSKNFQTGKEAEQIVKSLLETYIGQDRGIEIIFSMIEWEVKATRSPIQLFRGEEFPPRFIRCYTRLIGLEFAHKVLGDLISDIIDNQIMIELDEGKFKEEGNTLPANYDFNENLQLLQDYAQKFFDAIIGSLHYIPLPFLQIANYLTKQVKKRFPEPEATQAAVAGFIFLRFFCPCITSPETFEFPHTSIDSNVRRTLLLIGKVLQSLANGVTSFKEEYLVGMVPWLEKNKISLNEFVRHIREWPPRINGDSPNLVVSEFLIHKKKDKIRQQLQENAEFAGTSKAKWRQNIDTQPLSRLRGIMSNFVTETKPLVIPVQNTTPNRKQKTPSESKPNKKLVRSKFPEEKTSVLLTGLYLTILDSDGITVSVTKSLLTKKIVNLSQVAEICSCLGTIFVANDSIEQLMKSVIITEKSQCSSETEFLHDSVSQILFEWYTKNYATSWLSEQWKDTITKIVESNLYLEIAPEMAIDEVKLDLTENAEKLKQLCAILMDKAIGGINNCPSPLWEFCNILFDYTTQDVFQYLFINFFAYALEDPNAYQLTNKKPGKQALRTLAILSEMVGNLGNDSEFLIAHEPSCSIPMNKEERSKWVNMVKDWAEGEPEGLFLPPHTITWETERECYMTLTDYILENQDTIEEEIKKAGHVIHKVTFGIDELLESLKPPPQLPEEKAKPTGNNLTANKDKSTKDRDLFGRRKKKNPKGDKGEKGDKDKTKPHEKKA